MFIEVAVFIVYVPVLPFRLEDLGYKNVETLVNYASSAEAAGLAVGSPCFMVLQQMFSVRNVPVKTCCYWVELP